LDVSPVTFFTVISQWISAATTIVMTAVPPSQGISIGEIVCANQNGDPDKGIFNSRLRV